MSSGVIEYPYWDKTFIILNDPIIEKLSNPYIYGEEQQRILSETAKVLIKDLLGRLDDLRKSHCLIIRILEGGRYYYIYEELKKHVKNIKLGEIDIKSRFEYNPNDISTKIVEDLKLYDGEDKFDYVIVIDTIASGSTMTTFLNRFIDIFNDDYIMIIGGIVTLKGMERIKNRLSEKNIDFMFYAYGGLLGLGSNMTDMTLGDKPSYIPEELWNKATNNLGWEIASKLCVIGDFTYSNKYIDKYLAERLIQIWEIGKNSNDEDTKLTARKLLLEGLDRALTVSSLIELEKNLAEEYRRRLALEGRDINITNLDVGILLSMEDIKI